MKVLFLLFFLLNIFNYSFAEDKLTKNVKDYVDKTIKEDKEASKLISIIKKTYDIIRNFLLKINKIFSDLINGFLNDKKSFVFIYRKI